MLEKVMDYIHNYFVKEVYRGTFRITGGAIDLDFLQNGQYFKIVGSVFNDAVHQYPSSDLVDETFKGEVWAMAVPPAFIALCEEIEAWQEKYGTQVETPFSSESFGGYSYSKSQGGNANGSASPSASWQDIFRSTLNHWRKIS